jgi:hypothetical protein
VTCRKQATKLVSVRRKGDYRSRSRNAQARSQEAAHTIHAVYLCTVRVELLGRQAALKWRMPKQTAALNVDKLFFLSCKQSRIARATLQSATRSLPGSSRFLEKVRAAAIIYPIERASRTAGAYGVLDTAEFRTPRVPHTTAQWHHTQHPEPFRAATTTMLGANDPVDACTVA